MYDLKSYAELAARCSRCGSCSTICPVFQVSRQESLLARGKLHLAENVLLGKQNLNAEVEKRLNACLLCAACSKSCPSKAEADKIILAARAAAVKKHGLPFLKNLAFKHVVPMRNRFEWSLKALAVMQKYLPADQYAGSFYRHLPFSILNFSSKVAIPKLVKNSLSAQWQEVKVQRPKARIAFFSGCLTEFIYPEIGLALQSVLTKLGFEVVKPRQNCCSTPVIMSGEIEVAGEMAEENIRHFLNEDFDYIVTACASCGSALKNHYPQLLDDNETAADDFSAYVMDINEFLVKHTKITEYLDSNIRKITYHDPCHLARHQLITGEPRQLIQATGINLVEMEASDRCCGNGGTFSIYYPELSEKILDLKTRSIIATEADYLATACPGCLMQMRRGLAKRKAPQKAIHTIELINQALKL